MFSHILVLPPIWRLFSDGTRRYIVGPEVGDGWTLTHGHPKVTASGSYYNSIQYGVDDQARIDFDEVERLAKNKPKVIVAGNTAYPFELEFDKFRRIADMVGAWLVADISHVTGLVIAGEHQSPVSDADVVMSTTHKTFRGPRGAMIMVTDRGLQRDPDLGKKNRLSNYSWFAGWATQRDHRRHCTGCCRGAATRIYFVRPTN